MKDTGPQAGLTCSIVEPKDIGNCSNNGVSARYAKVTVIARPSLGEFWPRHIAGMLEAHDGKLVSIRSGAVHDPYDDAPPVVIIDRGKYGLAAVPVGSPPNAKALGPMFGGSYIATSDSRFREAVGGNVAVPLFDRFETQAQYNELSS